MKSLQNYAKAKEEEQENGLKIVKFDRRPEPLYKPKPKPVI